MPQFTLSILRHDQTSDLFTFEVAQVIIGREGGDIVTGDPQMSNRHAQLTFTGGVLVFEDLNSTNGSFRISGERITAPISVLPGTALRLGGCVVTIQDIQTGLERGGTAVIPQVNPLSFAPTLPPPAENPPAENRPHGAPPPEAHLGGLFDQFKAYLSTAADIYKLHYLGGVLTLGLVMVPATLVTSLFSLVPVVGWIVAILVGLIELALAPISAGAMGRWALAAATGRSMTWQQAWGSALKNPVSEWINMAVAMFITAVGTMLLIVPGIILGMFALPAYLLEGKQLLSINLRSSELVMKDPARHIGLAFFAMLTAVPVMIAAAIVSAIVVYVPIIGGPLASVISVAFSMVVVPFIYLLWSLVYYDARRRMEGEDAEQLHHATLDSWTA